MRFESRQKLNRMSELAFTTFPMKDGKIKRIPGPTSKWNTLIRKGQLKPCEVTTANGKKLQGREWKPRSLLSVYREMKVLIFELFQRELKEGLPLATPSKAGLVEENSLTNF